MKLNVLKLSILSIFAFLTIEANAQVKVGNNPTTITPSAIFDVESTNKGVIFPRIALTSVTDQTTIAAPAAGLLVYNTGAAALTYKGYVFWDGTTWRKLDGSHIISNVGDAEITASATVGPLVQTTENLSTGTGYHRTVTSPDGKFSVRVKIEQGYSIALSDLQIRSNVGTPTIIWNTETHWVNGILHNGDNSTTFGASGIWYGNGGGNGPTFNETGLGAAWGDPDVYFGGAPEYRRYTWTSTDTNDKTVYMLTFFLGAPTNNMVANAANCPSGTCSTTKAYLHIEQIKVN